MFLVQGTLTDADKALVVLQKSGPSQEQDVESLRQRNVKIMHVDDLNHATNWWIDVLRFVYARPKYIYRNILETGPRKRGL